MLANHRHEYIMDQLEKKGSVQTNDLIEELKVWPQPSKCQGLGSEEGMPSH